MRGHGFSDVRPVDDRVDWEGTAITRTRGSDTGRSARWPGSCIDARLYVAGDTVWCDEVRAALDEHRPAVVVVNAGGARFLEGRPFVMTVDDVVAVARYAPDVHVVAVHLEAINHCLETRADLHQRLHEEDLTGQVTVPENGAMVPLP